MFTEILNSFLNVRNKVKDVNGNWVDQTKPKEVQHMESNFSQTVNSDENVVVFSTWGKKVIIDMLEYGVSNESIHPKLTVAEGSESGSYSDQFFHVINNGSGRSFPSVNRLEQNGSQFLEVSYHESPNGKVMLKRPIILPEGCEFSFYVGSDDPGGEVTYKIYWREIEND